MSITGSLSGESEPTVSYRTGQMDRRWRHQQDRAPNSGQAHVHPEGSVSSTHTSMTASTNISQFNKAGVLTTPNPELTSSPLEVLEDFSDPDNELQEEIVEGHFEEGDRQFDAKQYVEAQTHFKKGLEHAEKLPMSRRKLSWLIAVRLKLAASAYNLSNMNEAEAYLFTIVRDFSTETNALDDTPTANKQAILVCQASHLLAIVLLYRHKYEAAKSYCRKAIVGRRTLLGKNHVTSYESQYLMSEILEAEGLHVDASIWLKKIPQNIISELARTGEQYPDDQDDDNGSHAQNEKVSEGQTIPVPEPLPPQPPPKHPARNSSLRRGNLPSLQPKQTTIPRFHTPYIRGSPPNMYNDPRWPLSGDSSPSPESDASNPSVVSLNPMSHQHNDRTAITRASATLLPEESFRASSVLEPNTFQSQPSEIGRASSILDPEQLQAFPLPPSNPGRSRALPVMESVIPEYEETGSIGPISPKTRRRPRPVMRFFRRKLSTTNQGRGAVGPSREIREIGVPSSPLRNGRLMEHLPYEKPVRSLSSPENRTGELSPPPQSGAARLGSNEKRSLTFGEFLVIKKMEEEGVDDAMPSWAGLF